MKILTIILAVFMSNLYAAEECAVASASPQAEELAEQNCEVTDKMSSCAQKPVDPDAARKRITQLFERTETDKDKIIANWKTYGASALAQLFDFDDKRQPSKDYKPTPLLDWMTNDGKADVTKDALRANMIEKYVEFAEKNDCTPIIKNRFVIVPYPANVKTKTAEELNKILKAPNYTAEKDARFKEMNANTLKSGTYCDYSAKPNPGPWTTVAQEYPPCTGNMSGLFADNVWSTSSLDSKMTSAATSEVMSCIKDRMAKGAKIHHISVVSSASALNNTGEAAKRFCKKGFLGLSEARAKAAQDKILPALFEGTDANYQSKVNLNFRGSNGDGTSGPCPYKLVDGKEVLKSEFASSAGKKTLDDDKYVRIHVTFESQTKSVQSEKKEYIPYYYCRNIYLECKPL
jgi:hypothetical protein